MDEDEKKNEVFAQNFKKFKKVGCPMESQLAVSLGRISFSESSRNAKNFFSSLCDPPW